MTEIQAFTGFPPEGFQFFKDIAANNNREWFQAHKQDYIEYLQHPALAFIVEFGERLRKLVPGINFDTRTNGAGSLMRIYRDIRFSKDKSPYKDHLGMNFWDGTTKKETPGVHFWMDRQGGLVYSGFHAFPKPYLAAYRQAVADDQHGGRLEQAVAGLSDQPGFEIGGEQLKRVPPGYDREHPRGDLLRYKGLYARGPRIDPADLRTPQLIDACLQQVETMLPLHKWLSQVHRDLQA